MVLDRGVKEKTLKKARAVRRRLLRWFVARRAGQSWRALLGGSSLWKSGAKSKGADVCPSELRSLLLSMNLQRWCRPAIIPCSNVIQPMRFASLRPASREALEKGEVLKKPLGCSLSGLLHDSFEVRGFLPNR